MNKLIVQSHGSFLRHLGVFIFAQICDLEAGDGGLAGLRVDSNAGSSPKPRYLEKL